MVNRKLPRNTVEEIEQFPCFYETKWTNQCTNLNDRNLLKAGASAAEITGQNLKRRMPLNAKDELINCRSLQTNLKFCKMFW